MIKEHLRGKFRLEYIKFWVRMSWLTLYQSTSGFIKNLDVMVFSLVTGSLVGLAYWTVGQVVGNVVAHSQQISQGLYPKLLATRKKEYAQENFKHLMIFSIPFLAASIVFAKPALHIINPIYLDGIYIVILLSIKSFIFMISDTCFTILGAYETVDINKQASFKQFVKSKLFFLPAAMRERPLGGVTRLPASGRRIFAWHWGHDQTRPACFAEPLILLGSGKK